MEENYNLRLGSAVMALTAGNFIFGHVTDINEDRVTIKADLGYYSSKPYFKLKPEYNIAMKYVSLLDETEHNELD